ncbi:MAG: hypothetical protein WCC36_01490, partial [Gammaproteobacteria bacterium]
MGRGLRVTALHLGLIAALAAGNVTGETLGGKLDKLQKALERQDRVAARQRERLAEQARELARQRALIEQQLRDLDALRRQTMARRQMENAR